MTLGVGWGSASTVLAQQTQGPWFEPSTAIRQVWCYMTEILALWRWRQEDHKFKVTLSYIASLKLAWPMYGSISKNFFKLIKFSDGYFWIENWKTNSPEICLGFGDFVFLLLIGPRGSGTLGKLPLSNTLLEILEIVMSSKTTFLGLRCSSVIWHVLGTQGLPPPNTHRKGKFTL